MGKQRYWHISRRNSTPRRAESGGRSSPLNDDEITPDLAEQYDFWQRLNGDDVDEDQAIERAERATAALHRETPRPEDYNGADVDEYEAIERAIQANRFENEKNRPVQSVEDDDEEE